VIEIIWLWNAVKEKRFGRFIAAGLIGSVVLITTQHLVGSEASRRFPYYLISILLGIWSGASCGLIVFVADLGDAFIRACGRSTSVRIQLMAVPCLIVVGVFSLLMIVQICIMLLFWSDYVFGCHLFRFSL